MSEISDVLDRARREPSTENLTALWRAVLRLPVWYFLPADAPGHETFPMVAEFDGGRWLLACTNIRRFGDLCRGLQITQDSEELPMLVVSTRDAIDRIEAVAPSIDGVAFNSHSVEHFRIPTDALLRFATDMLPTGV
jgi:hypothetical protein